MITKEQFIEIITGYREYINRIDEVCDTLNCCLWEADWIEYTSKLFDQVLKISFNDYGFDDITWWIFEKNGRREMTMRDENDVEISTETLDDLWEIVKDNRI